MVGPAAAADHVEVGQRAAKRLVFDRKRRGISGIERIGVVELSMALRGGVGSQPTDPFPESALRRKRARKVGRVRTVDHEVRRSFVRRRVDFVDCVVKCLPVGETTVGMAIIQRLVPTGSGGSLFMTVGRYQSPSGTILGGKGLQPDERVITFPGDTESRDPILEKGLEVARRGALRQVA